MTNDKELSFRSRLTYEGEIFVLSSNSTLHRIVFFRPFDILLPKYWKKSLVDYHFILNDFLIHLWKPQQEVFNNSLFECRNLCPERTWIRKGMGYYMGDYNSINSRFVTAPLATDWNWKHCTVVSVGVIANRHTAMAPKGYQPDTLQATARKQDQLGHVLNNVSPDRKTLTLLMITIKLKCFESEKNLHFPWNIVPRERTFWHTSTPQAWLQIGVIQTFTDINIIIGFVSPQKLTDNILHKAKNGSRVKWTCKFIMQRVMLYIPSLMIAPVPVYQSWGIGKVR